MSNSGLRALGAWLVLILLALPAAAQTQDGDPGKSPGGPAPADAATPATPASASQGVVGARWPCLSPDGSRIAFTLWGDIWVVPAAGGRGTRLTMNESNDIRPLWSPDGKRIVFSTDRSGSFDLWVMPADGGTPTRLTYNAATEVANSWPGDGSHIYFQSNESGDFRIYRLPADGGTPELVTLDNGVSSSVRFGADGRVETVYYCYQISDAKVKGYRGSLNDEIYSCKPGEIPVPLTHNDLNEREPRIAPDGKTLYFIRETGLRGKDYNLFALQLETREEKQLTALDDNGLSQTNLSQDGRKIVFVWKYRVWSLELGTEKAAPVLIPIEVIEDTRRESTVERTVASGAESVDLSADGKRLTLEIGGSLWIMDANGGRATALTGEGSEDSMPRFSPDGKWIAFFSNRKGNHDLFLIGADGQNLRQLTFSPEPEHFMAWAPDGRSLLYSADRNNIRNLYRLNLDGSGAQQITNHNFNTDDPSVSPDGRWIAYDAWAKGNADIYVAAANGQGARLVYGTLAQEESPRWSPDGKLLVFTRTTQTGTANTRQVVVTDLQGSGEVIIGDGHDGSFTPDGKEIIYVDGGGMVKASPAPSDVSGGRTIQFLATRKVAQSEEFRRVFEEAFKRIVEGFYDAKYHGNDMQALRKRYLPLVSEARNRMEFYNYMNELVGELSASHQGVNGPITDVPGFGTGLLGCTLIPEVMERKKGDDEKQPQALRLRVTRLGKGGPVDKAWIRDGDYVFGVDDKRLTVKDNFDQKLENRVNQPVNLLVGSRPDASDLRTVAVTPEDWGARRNREYQNWIAQCRQRTREWSENKVAYIHIPEMSQNALRNFENELGSKEVQATQALVLDVRNNGGGNIHQQLIDILSRRHYADNWTQKGEPTKSPNLFWERPVVLLINRRSYSDAEVFPHAFRTLKLGTVVGEPTSGSVIGTNDITLSDGTGLRVTTWGFKNLDGTNQERNGCQPDVLVELTPQDRIEDNDPQLRKAVDIALEKIAPPQPKPTEAQPAEPPKQPEQPPVQPPVQPVTPDQTPDGKPKTPGDAPADPPKTPPKEPIAQPPVTPTHPETRPDAPVVPPVEPEKRPDTQPEKKPGKQDRRGPV